MSYPSPLASCFDAIKPQQCSPCPAPPSNSPTTAPRLLSPSIGVNLHGDNESAHRDRAQAPSPSERNVPSSNDFDPVPRRNWRLTDPGLIPIARAMAESPTIPAYALPSNFLFPSNEGSTGHLYSNFQMGRLHPSEVDEVLRRHRRLARRSEEIDFNTTPSTTPVSASQTEISALTNQLANTNITLPARLPEPFDRPVSEEYDRGIPNRDTEESMEWCRTVNQIIGNATDSDHNEQAQRRPRVTEAGLRARALRREHRLSRTPGIPSLSWNPGPPLPKPITLGIGMPIRPTDEQGRGTDSPKHPTNEQGRQLREALVANEIELEEKRDPRAVLRYRQEMREEVVEKYGKCLVERKGWERLMRAEDLFGAEGVRRWLKSDPWYVKEERKMAWEERKIRREGRKRREEKRKEEERKGKAKNKKPCMIL